jgi:hypothetical protein
MLSCFEDYTHDLTEKEKALVSFFVLGFENKRGSENAITNSKIRATILDRKGIKISDARVRKIINYIRIYDLVPGLIATSRGYYVSADPEEILKYIESLVGRKNEIGRLIVVMRFYMDSLKQKQ